MPLNNNVAPVENPYTLVSANKTKAPQKSEGNDWYQYIEKRDGSTGVGYMRGTLLQVTEYARDDVEKLNFRFGTRTNSFIYRDQIKKTLKPKS